MFTGYWNELVQFEISSETFDTSWMIGGFFVIRKKESFES